MIWLLATLALGGGAPAEPSDATLIYLNARLALREERALDATKLWLLRNAHEDQTGRVSPHDEDFHSITWVALGDLGVCQDGHPRDKDGAGLWPLALHNWVVRNRGRRGSRDRPRPFRAFEVGRQQRFIAIGDVLGSEELRSVSVFRGRCLGPQLTLLESGELPTARLKDRLVAARLLRWLLIRSRATLSDEVRGRAVVDARLFDVHLQIMQLAAIEARRQARDQSRLGRMLGLGRPSVTAMREDAPTTTFSDSSAPARILRRSVQWPVQEWMALSPERRIFVFDQARSYLGATEGQVLDQRALEIVDALIARGEGEAVLQWIPRTGGDPTAVWSGERGRRLLGLDRESGFTERAIIALHRGVDQLQTGELDRALRSLAYAVQVSPESQAAGEVQSLSLRWLSYVAAQFEITDSLLITLQELLPRREYSVILEDLMWSAAFRADERSFAYGLRNQVGRGALDRRVTLLTPLASGDTAAFSAGIEQALEESPGEVLRFVDQLVQRLELEDLDVRTNQRPTLLRLRALLEPLADPAGQARQARRVAALQRRTLALLEGSGGPGPDTSLRDQARALAPGSEIFAGSVRLAPSDALPWPFQATEVSAPTIFTPLEISPIEWRDADGQWVYGWSIEG